jgi:hypothetical protein
MPEMLYCAEAKTLLLQLQTQVCQPHGPRDSPSQRSGFNNKCTCVFRNCFVKQTGSNTRIRVYINKALLFHPVLRSLCPGGHNSPSFLKCCKVVRGWGKENSPLYYPPLFPIERLFLGGSQVLSISSSGKTNK